MNPFVALLLGSGVGIGLVIMLAGLRGEAVLPGAGARDRNRHRRRGPTAGPQLRSWGIGLGVGFVVWLLTGWLAAGLLSVLAAVVLPRMWVGQTARQAWIAKTEAIAAWTEMLRDTMSAADGVEAAIAATVPIAPESIRNQVALLDARRRSEQPLSEALAIFGHEVDHPSCDLVVASLSSAAQGEGSDFVGVLTRLAAITRDEVRMRLRVEAGRAQVRTSSRMIVAILLCAIVVLSLLSEDFFDPYGTSFGQVWLLLVGAVFAGGILLLERMGRIDLPERFSPRRARRT
ncbi:MAG: type II secretion system F family protein [Acidimicrobiales bacterium]